MAKEDNILVQDFQQGNVGAFEVLYQRYMTKIYSFVLIKSGGNVALAQDITSDTFLKAFDHLPNFTQTEKGTFSARLYRIAYHCFIDVIKGKSSETVILHAGNEVVEMNDMIDLYEKKMLTKDIVEYLETLGSEKKDIFLLRIWEELSYDEIAEIVGKSAESCRQDFSRTMKKVEEKFKAIV
ncbi:MAG: RNA polymerase sigma factor [Candidatus Peribacteria bacterium]|jgi:RNA polymerase sigma-70 factor (ECF subfamily)|nr:RNA polymerase sigma factor [Candidatus Peribacteria bacterium]